MDISILTARVLGIAYLVFGVGVLLNGDYYHKILKGAFKEKLYAMFGGMMSVVAGVLIVMYHNIWASDWTVIITVFGWLALVKGVVLLAFPRSLYVFESLYSKRANTTFIGVLVLALGLMFAYFGFIA